MGNFCHVKKSLQNLKNKGTQAGYKNIVEGLEKRNQVTQNRTPEKNTLNKANLAFTFTQVNRYDKKQSS
jgi:hypothetical protein